MIKTTTNDAKKSLAALGELDSRAVTLGTAMGNVPYQYSSATTLKILGLRMALEDSLKGLELPPDDVKPIDSSLEVQADALNIKELNIGPNSPQNNIPPSVLHRLVSLNLLTLKSD